MAHVRRPAITARTELGSVRTSTSALIVFVRGGGSLILNIAICRQCVELLRCPSMRYSYKSLAFVWLITFGLFAGTGSGLVTGPRLLLLLGVALVAPALILRRPAGATMTSQGRGLVGADDRDRSSLDLGGIDVSRWENDGGAGSQPVVGGIREPAQAACNASLSSRHTLPKARFSLDDAAGAGFLPPLPFYGGPLSARMSLGQPCAFTAARSSYPMVEAARVTPSK
jgi:hypothetical protein